MPDLLGVLGYGPFTGYCGYLGDQANRIPLKPKISNIRHNDFWKVAEGGGSCTLGLCGNVGYSGYFGYLV